MFKWRYLLFILIVSGFCNTMQATHNRAGEITYSWISGYTYRIKITTYTNIGGSNLADRCEDTLYFGDGARAIVARSNGTVVSYCSSAKGGVNISSTIRKNEYETTHTYPGPGAYRMSMTDPNRNAGVINLPNSVNQVFYIESYLVISTFIGPNSSPVLTFPPIDKGCVNRCFLHNPGAYDPDGDSLSYELTYCRGQNGNMCPGYTYPATGAGGTYNVNPTTGTLTWCSPQQQGEYNLAMYIQEWRKDADGKYKLVGYVIRDLQVDVGTCNNNSPNILPLTDTCVVAGSTITKTIRANDPDGNVIKLTANGGPFNVPSSPSTFASAQGLSPITGQFNWQTNCSHIRKSPYQVTVKVEDQLLDPNDNLVDFKTFNIRVVAPPPLNFTATPMGTSVRLSWRKPLCAPTSGNKIKQYCVYRKADCNPWTPGLCETGVPASSGYVKIGCTANMNDTTFIDTNNGNGLSQGTNYSYVVESVYDDGSLSYASSRVCVQLKRDVPILINVDVQSTGTSGAIFVRWIKPLLGINALDTVAVPGPYEFRLMHHDGYTGTFTQVASVSKPYFKALNQLTDTTFIHNAINTATVGHTYKIEFYANGQFIGNGQKAASIFLSLVPGDNTLTLNWQQQVPWTNFRYYIYRKAPSQTSFTLHDSVGTTTSYVDDSLVNGAEYCYKVLSKGQYSDPNIFRPLLNFSQEACGKPVDTTPPCSPTLTIQSDCKIPALSLIWNNPNHVCSDDAVRYKLYFAETEDAPLVLWDSINIITDTIINFDKLESIAGCYAITAIDSFNNESLQSAKVCVDNCPEYELPNVITVNGDGINDFFKPIVNKFVRDIDLKIYNRWGNLVYETTDPKINWDGKSMQMKQLVVEGTYFYVCQVNEIRVAGIKSRYLKGFVQVFHK